MFRKKREAQRCIGFSQDKFHSATIKLECVQIWVAWKEDLLFVCWQSCSEEKAWSWISHLEQSQLNEDWELSFTEIVSKQNYSNLGCVQAIQAFNTNSQECSHISEGKG